MADRSPTPVRIRSFRVVFRLERRLHRLGPWRLPLPYGLPLVGLGYGAAALAAVLLAARLPLLGPVLSMLPVPARLGVLPALIAWALLRVRPDGRALGRALASRFRRRLAPRRVAGFRRAAPPGRVVRIPDLAVASDLYGPVLSRARLRVPRRGSAPVSALLRYPCRVEERGRTIRIAQVAGDPLWEPVAVTVAPGRRLVLQGPRVEA